MTDVVQDGRIDHDALSRIASGDVGCECVGQQATIRPELIGRVLALSDKQAIAGSDDGILYFGVGANNCIAVRVWLPAHSFDEFECAEPGTASFWRGGLEHAVNVFQHTGAELRIDVAHDEVTQRTEDGYTVIAPTVDYHRLPAPDWSSQLDAADVDVTVGPQHRYFVTQMPGVDVERVEFAALPDGMARLTTVTDDDHSLSVEIGSDCVDVGASDEPVACMIAHEFYDDVCAAYDGSWRCRWGDETPLIIDRVVTDQDDDEILAAISFMVAPRIYNDPDQPYAFEGADQVTEVPDRE